MGDGFVKIYGDKLMDSTLWLEPPEVRLVFLSMLAVADENGVIDVPGLRALARKLNLPLEYLEPALERLMEPDPDSRSEAEDGRRVLKRQRPDVGWQCVNYEAYREFRGKKVEQARIRQQRKRARDAGRDDRDSNAGHATSASASTSASEDGGDSLIDFAKAWRGITGRSDFEEFVAVGQVGGTEHQALEGFRRACGGSVAEFRSRVSARLAEEDNGFLLKQTLLHWVNGPIKARAEAPKQDAPGGTEDMKRRMAEQEISDH